MRKIVYSSITKTIAFLLCISAIVFGSYRLISLVVVADREWDGVYNFESDFSESNALQSGVMQPFWHLINMFSANNDSVGVIENIMDNSHVEYYAERNGNEIISNTANTDYAYYNNSEYSITLLKDYGKNAELGGGMKKNFYYRYFDSESVNSLDNEESFKIFVRLNDDYIREIRTIWYNSQKTAHETFFYCLTSALIALLMLIYLLCACGRKNGDDYIHTMLIDRMYVEINAALIFFSGFGFICAIIWLAEDIWNSNLDSMFLYAIAALAALGSALEITLIMSLARNIKNRTFTKRSIIVWAAKNALAILNRIWMIIKKAFSKLKYAITYICRFICRDKIAGLLALSVTGYTLLAVIFVFLMFAAGSFSLFILFPIGFLMLIYYILKTFSAYDKIREGILQIHSGNIDYKITGVEKGIAGEVALAVNNIGDGLMKSVDEQIKAEKMKTELITNVSHDLKTPLTSIINYTNLLSDMQLKPTEANDYVTIIKGKSERLKNLTQDLFDISKVQSGNDNISLEKLDISLLINQTVGELDESIKSSGLEFILSLKENTYILADGKKMSRVFENLIGNIIKYSMKNTRVYITSSVNPQNVTVELKNISAYPLNFDTSEITNRFVRGDESRSTEGNGLGLAIAKSYTEICGGKFKIVTDGDLFKAIISFDRKL